MSQDILISPPQLRAMAKNLCERAQRIQAALDAVDQAVKGLNQVHFSGQRAISLTSRYQKQRSAIFSAPNVVLSFASNLEQAAAVFEKADAASANKVPRNDLISWKNGERITSRIIDILGNLHYKDYRDVGRGFNTLIGNSKGGWVGRLDEFGHIVKSPAFDTFTKYGMPIIGGVIDYFDDKDPNRIRAGETAAVKTVGEVAIASTGVGAAVLTVNGAVQLSGDVVEWGCSKYGQMYGGDWKAIFNERKSILEDNFDRIDLGNFTQDAAHLVVDTNFPEIKMVDGRLMIRDNAFTSAGMAEIASNLILGKMDIADIPQNYPEIKLAINDIVDLANHSKDFVETQEAPTWTKFIIPGGITDTSINMYETYVIFGAATVDNLGGVLPIPADWQAAIHNGTIEFAQRLNQ